MGAVTAVVVEGGHHDGISTTGARVSIGDFPPRFRSVLAVGDDLLIALRAGEQDAFSVGDIVTVRVRLGQTDATRHTIEAREGLTRLGLGDIPLSDGDAIQTYAFVAEAATPQIQATRVASIREGGLSRDPLDASAP